MVQIIGLANHDYNILRMNTPVKTIELGGGRKQVLFDGERLEDYILYTVPVSGLPAPQVLPTCGGLPRELTLLLDGDIQIPLTVYEDGGTIYIKDLPAPVEGVYYLTSYAAASTAFSQGRRDVLCPGTLVLERNEDGSTRILGCLGLKQGV